VGFGQPACLQAAGALLPHLFTFACALRKWAIGCVVSVPLSVGSPRLRVTKHHALWSSDFPRRLKNRAAAVQPTRYLYYTQCKTFPYSGNENGRARGSTWVPVAEGILNNLHRRAGRFTGPIPAGCRHQWASCFQPCVCRDTAAGPFRQDSRGVQVSLPLPGAPCVPRGPP